MKLLKTSAALAGVKPPKSPRASNKVAKRVTCLGASSYSGASALYPLANGQSERNGVHVKPSRWDLPHASAHTCAVRLALRPSTGSKITLYLCMNHAYREMILVQVHRRPSSHR